MTVSLGRRARDSAVRKTDLHNLLYRVVTQFVYHPRVFYNETEEEKEWGPTKLIKRGKVGSRKVRERSRSPGVTNRDPEVSTSYSYLGGSPPSPSSSSGVGPVPCPGLLGWVLGTPFPSGGGGNVRVPGGHVVGPQCPPKPLSIYTVDGPEVRTSFVTRRSRISTYPGKRKSLFV